MKAKKQVLFATENKAKVKYYKPRIEAAGFEVITPSMLNLSLDIEETGSTPIENAVIKAKAYYDATKVMTFANDEGLFFKDVPEEVQPGVYARRVNGVELNDHELIEHYQKLISTYGTDGMLEGYFLFGMAVVSEDVTQVFEDKGYRHFVDVPCDTLEPGYPLASLQIIPKYNKYKAELSVNEEKDTIDIEQKDIIDFLIRAMK